MNKVSDIAKNNVYQSLSLIILFAVRFKVVFVFDNKYRLLCLGKVMPRNLPLLLIFTFLVMPVAQAKFVEVVAKIKPSVVGVGLHTPTSRPQNILRGTGFVIGDGHYIVTNEHVLPTLLDDSLLQKIAIFIGSGKTAKVRKAEIVAKSSLYDLAILKISGPALPATTLANSDFLSDGSAIAFTGFPIGSVLGLYPVTHRGIISSTTPTVIPAASAGQINLKMLKRMKNPYLVYQLDATAYPGNSGSALYDMETGEVVGIINKVFVQGTKEAVISAPSGITYAIPVKYLYQVLKENKIKI
jgi:S1-C subfamily serine protease